MTARNNPNPKRAADLPREVPEVQKKLAEAMQREFAGVVEALPGLAWEYGLTVGVTPEKAKDLFRALKERKEFDFNMLIDVTCVDWLDKREPRFDVVYQLLSVTHGHRLCVKIQVGEEKPVVDSVRDLWDAAWFLEREAWDMYGVEFHGNGDLRRVLMYDEFVGHPLRKDYPIRGKQPRIPLRIPELRNTSQDMAREQLVSLPVRPQARRSEH